MRVFAALFLAGFSVGANAQPQVIGIVGTEPPLSAAFVKSDAGWTGVNCTETNCSTVFPAKKTLPVYDAGKIVGDISFTAYGALLANLPVGDPHAMIALAEPVPAAPPRWRAVNNPDPLDAAWPAFHKAIPKIAVCHNHDEAPPVPSRPFHMRALDAWRSAGGETLLHLGVDYSHGENTCDGGPALQEEVLLLRGKDGAFTILPGQFIKSPVEFALVAIGDYDGDGSDEAVFSFGGLDTTGYLLSYDGFRRSARVITDHYELQ